MPVRLCEQLEGHWLPESTDLFVFIAQIIRQDPIMGRGSAFGENWRPCELEQQWWPETTDLFAITAQIHKQDSTFKKQKRPGRYKLTYTQTIKIREENKAYHFITVHFFLNSHVLRDSKCQSLSHDFAQLQEFLHLLSFNVPIIKHH